MKLFINNKYIEILEYKSIFKKFIGLMFKKEKLSYGIRLNNCNSIHTFFMKQNIDIVITDKNNKVLFIKRNLKKNKVILPIKNGYYTYELPKNSINNLNINDILTIKNK